MLIKRSKVILLFVSVHIRSCLCQYYIEIHSNIMKSLTVLI